MVVDDSAVVRQRLKSVIESDPRFRVTLAADPYEAVALLSKSVPGVIVLDVEMPRMDGLTFLRKLMRQHPMPVVLCTDQAERSDRPANGQRDRGDRQARLARPRADGGMGSEHARKHSQRRPRRPAADPRRTAFDRSSPHRRRHPSQAAVRSPGRDHRAAGGRRRQHRGRSGRPAAAGRLSRRFARDRDRSAHAARLHRRLRRAAQQRPEDRRRGLRSQAPRPDPRRGRSGDPPATPTA